MPWFERASSMKEGVLKNLYYTNNDSTLEIDFIVQYKNSILPIEVKAEENLQSKSLKSFLAKYPNLRGISFSMSPYSEQQNITNVPLGCIKGFSKTPLKHCNYFTFK